MKFMATRGLRLSVLEAQPVMIGADVLQLQAKGRPLFLFRRAELAKIGRASDTKEEGSEGVYIWHKGKRI